MKEFYYFYNNKKKHQPIPPAKNGHAGGIGYNCVIDKYNDLWAPVNNVAYRNGINFAV